MYKRQPLLPTPGFTAAVALPSYMELCHECWSNVFLCIKLLFSGTKVDIAIDCIYSSNAIARVHCGGVGRNCCKLFHWVVGFELYGCVTILLTLHRTLWPWCSTVLTQLVWHDCGSRPGVEPKLFSNDVSSHTLVSIRRRIGEL